MTCQIERAQEQAFQIPSDTTLGQRGASHEIISAHIPHIIGYGLFHGKVFLNAIMFTDLHQAKVTEECRNQYRTNQYIYPTNKRKTAITDKMPRLIQFS